MWQVNEGTGVSEVEWGGLRPDSRIKQWMRGMLAPLVPGGFLLPVNVASPDGGMLLKMKEK